MCRNRLNHFFWFTQLIAVIIASNACFCQKDSNSIWQDEIDTKIKQEMLKYHVTGVAIGIFDSGKLLYTKGYGYSDVAKGNQITDTTSFHIASLSKSFTALAIMQLVEQNKLDIDVPVRRYLPNLQFEYDTYPNGSDFTTREVLCHLSGLPNDIWNNFSDFRGPVKDHIIQSLNKLGAFGPRNLNFAYSNIGYGLLTLLIEKVSGSSYVDFLQEHIFSPLEMKNTFVYGEEEHKDYDLSKGFHKGHSYTEPYFRDVGAISICSSISDLGNYLNMYLHYGKYKSIRLLDSVHIQEMYSNHLSALPLQEYHGYGLGLGCDNRLFKSDDTTRTILELSHDGATDFFHSGMKFYPELGCGFVVLTNSKNGMYIQDPSLLSNLYFKTKYHASIEKVEQKKQSPVLAAFFNDLSLDNSVASKADEKHIEGTYNLSYRMLRVKNTRRFPIFLDGKKAMAKSNEDGTYNIGVKFLGLFYYYFSDYILEFIAHKNHVYMRTDDQLNTTYTYVGIKEDYKPFLTGWTSYKGKYLQQGYGSPNQSSPYLFTDRKMALKKRGNRLLVVVRYKSGRVYSKTYMNTLQNDFAHCFNPNRNYSDALRILPNGNLYYQGAEFCPKNQRK